MPDMDTIEQELRQYLTDAPNLTPQDRLNYLMAIFRKHFELSKVDHLLTMNDFQAIVSYAKASFASATLPMTISKRQIYPSEVAHVLMLESVLVHLNKFKVLKRLVRIDHTQR